MTPYTGLPFPMWYDDSPKHTLGAKVDAARAAFAERFGVHANVVLVSPDCADPLPDGAKRSARVRPNTVWAGREI